MVTLPVSTVFIGLFQSILFFMVSFSIFHVFSSLSRSIFRLPRSLSLRFTSVFMDFLMSLFCFAWSLSQLPFCFQWSFCQLLLPSIYPLSSTLPILSQHLANLSLLTTTFIFRCFHSNPLINLPIFFLPFFPLIRWRHFECRNSVT